MAQHPVLDEDMISTADHAHEAEHTTGNEGWNPMKIEKLNTEWASDVNGHY